MRKLALHLSILILAASVASCTEVSFPIHQPKGEPALAEFPEKLRGMYITSDSDSLRDTLMIATTNYLFFSAKSQQKSDWLGQGQLSDSLVIKEYKGYYFVNFKENDQWLMRVVKQRGNGDITFLTFAIDGTGKDKLLSELQRELPVETIQVSSSDKYYRIDPTPKKLIQLIKKKKYWEESVLVRLREKKPDKR